MSIRAACIRISIVLFLHSASAYGEKFHPPITAPQAQQIVEHAMTTYRPGARLFLTKGQLDPGFYDFEALSNNPTGSPVVGYFSVNELTGDVWDLAGHCRRITSPSLKKMQDDIRQQAAISEKDFRIAQTKKPGCDAD